MNTLLPFIASAVILLSSPQERTPVSSDLLRITTICRLACPNPINIGDAAFIAEAFSIKETLPLIKYLLINSVGVKFSGSESRIYNKYCTERLWSAFVCLSDLRPTLDPNIIPDRDVALHYIKLAEQDAAANP